MPLLLTPAQPLRTTAQLPVTTVYAIIERVGWARRGLQPMVIVFEVAYYANEATSVAEGVAAIQLTDLPVTFSQPASPQEADAVGIFTFLEQVLTQQLTPLLGAGATIENVP